MPVNTAVRPSPTAKASPWPVVIAGLIVVATAVALTVLITRAAARPNEYARSSPDDLIKSAVSMIRNGEASRLVELFHAESPEGQAIKRRIGELLGSMQRLGLAVAERFPEEVERLREEAIQKAGESATAGSLASIFQNRPRPGAAGPGGRGVVIRRDTLPDGSAPPPGISARVTIGDDATPAPAARRGPPGPGDERALQDFAKTLFADPFGWIDRNADRLTTAIVSDDQAAVLLDGKPVPPVGLLLREVNGQWYIDLPTNFPGAAQFLPQTRHEWSILGSLFKVLDNVIAELADEVRLGKIGRVDLLAEKAGEKAFGPAAMVFIVYGKEMDIRARRERVMSEYKKKSAEWVVARADLKASLGPDWFTRLVEAMDKLTIEEVDRLLRHDTTRPSRDAPRATPAFAGMTPETLESTLEGWLAAKGCTVRLAAATRDDVEAVALAAAGRPARGKR